MTRSRAGKNGRDAATQKGQTPPAAESLRRDSISDDSSQAGLRQRVCFICGDRCSLEETKLVRTRADSRSSFSGDVFPFLANKDPAPGAQPASGKGRVFVCVSCYSTLSDGHEDAGASASTEHSPLFLERSLTRSVSTVATPRTALSSVEVCYLCGHVVDEPCFLETSRSAQDPSCPYFPSLLSAPRAANSRPIVGDGRVLVCGTCHGGMIEKWKSYQRDNVPVENRTYEFYYACYLCSSRTAESQMTLVSSQQSRELQRFFPFLRGHTPAVGAGEMTTDGLAMTCISCRDCLYEQFDDFAANRVAFPDRVYRLRNGGKFHEISPMNKVRFLATVCLPLVAA